MVTVTVRQIFGDTAGNPDGEVCTVGTPDISYRSNSLDGVRRGGNDQPVLSIGAMMQDLMVGVADDGTVVVGPAAKRVPRNTSGPVRWHWPTLNNSPPWACHP